MEFGPSRSSCHPEYPFWRLQSDGLWEVPEPSRFRRRKNNTDALKSELIRFHACGGFPQNIYETLKKRPEIVRGLAQDILAAHFPDSLHDAIASEVGLNLYGRERSSERDPAFRAAVLAAWGHQCAFCGFSVQLDNTDLALEAAHIRWVQAGGPDGINNGLACCSVHHQALDRGAMSLTGDLTILVVCASPWLRKAGGAVYQSDAATIARAHPFRCQAESQSRRVAQTAGVSGSAPGLKPRCLGAQLH